MGNHSNFPNERELGEAIQRAALRAFLLYHQPIEILGLLAHSATVLEVQLYEVRVSTFTSKFEGYGAVAVEFACEHARNGSKFVFTRVFLGVVTGHIEDAATYIDYASIEEDHPFSSEAEPEVASTPPLPKVVFLELGPDPRSAPEGETTLGKA